MSSSEPTFENAMERLEQIVQQMESDKLPLEEMLERYEEGTKLVKVCSEKLAAAEKRIEIIARNASGKPQIAEFDPSQAASVAPVSPSKQSKTPSNPASQKPAPRADDVSLF